MISNEKLSKYFIVNDYYILQKDGFLNIYDKQFPNFKIVQIKLESIKFVKEYIDTETYFDSIILSFTNGHEINDKNIIMDNFYKFYNGVHKKIILCEHLGFYTTDKKIYEIMLDDYKKYIDENYENINQEDFLI